MINPQLEGKTAVVTGANNPYGLGAAIALALAAQGVKIFLHYYRNPTSSSLPASDMPGEAFYLAQGSKEPDEVLAAIHNIGGQAVAWEADLSDPAVIPRLFDAAEVAFGQVDILVNNAAYWEADTFLSQPEEVVNKAVEMWTDAPQRVTAVSIDNLFAVITRATALMMAEFGDRVRQRQGNWGRIINISTDGAYSFPSEVSYGASKLAMEGYSRSAAQELGQFGITVNILSPGPIQTGWITPELEASCMAHCPLGRIGQPEDIADVAVFLASVQARWVTGQTIHVGGGNKM